MLINIIHVKKMELLSKPWPWWAAGIIIGLIVPALLILGNKHFGLSANLRHACAACFPANVKFFKYDWKKEVWNFFFVGGIIAGAILASTVFANPEPVKVAPELAAELQTYGITDYSGMVPIQLISWESLFTLRGLIMLVFGGFLVGFGSRYAGGCTSGAGALTRTVNMGRHRGMCRRRFHSAVLRVARAA